MFEKYGTCSKCNGKGVIPCYTHRDYGKCYQCNGTGKVEIKEEKISHTSNCENKWEHQKYKNRGFINPIMYRPKKRYSKEKMLELGYKWSCWFNGYIHTDKLNNDDEILNYESESINTYQELIEG